jgi:cytosine/adenosine deaminase-related metal-dependent hydrolase
MLLHLSEGVTDPADPESRARRHFRALEIAAGTWALNDRFTGIHAAGLLPEDFDVLASHRASIVWSPFSNLLLYGGTARVEAAAAAGVRIGLGSDWSPTGSKNLLGELRWRGCTASTCSAACWGRATSSPWPRETRRAS